MNEYCNSRTRVYDEIQYSGSRRAVACVGCGFHSSSTPAQPLGALRAAVDPSRTPKLSDSVPWRSAPLLDCALLRAARRPQRAPQILRQ